MSEEQTGFEALGEVSELTETEDFLVEEITGSNPMVFGGDEKKTTWSADQKGVMRHKRTRLLITGDGLIVRPDLIVGVCAECKEHGINNVLSKITARKCETCGRLLGPCHQRIVAGKVYCSRHWFWAWIEQRRTGGEQGQIPETTDAPE